MAVRFQDQVARIEAIGRRLGYPVDTVRWFDALADAAGINRESMRKYACGYQPMPEDKFSALGLVEQNRLLQTRQSTPSAQSSLGEAYSLMPTDVLAKNLLHVSTQIEAAPNASSLRLLAHVRAMVTEMEGRFQSSDTAQHATAPASAEATNSTGLSSGKRVLEKAAASVLKPRDAK